MPKPKTGKSVPPTPPKKPGDVNVVAEVKAGVVTAVKAAKNDKLKQAKFSPVKIKPPKPPPKAPPPVKESDKPCGVAGLDILDKENRKPGPGGGLQVVPKPDKNVADTYGLLEVAKLKIQTAGTETVTAKVKSVDGKPVGRKQTCWLKNGAPPDEGDWKDGDSASYTLPASPNKDKWPYPADPVYHYIYGRGCDECVLRTRVEVFPSQQVEFEISAQAIKKWKEDFSKGILAYLLKIFGEEEEESGLKLFEGKITVKWGWKEDPKTWRAYYNVEANGGCDPLVGWEKEFTFSLSKIAMTGAGVPPPLAGIIDKHIASIYLSFTPTVGISCTVAIAAKFYADGEHAIEGKGTVEGGGSINFALAARLGSELVVAVIAKAGAKTGVKASGEFTATSEGLDFGPKVEWTGLSLYVEVVFKVCKKSVKEKNRTWEVCEARTLYPGDDNPRWPYRLFPRDANTP
jgi:hypothetical protein